MKNLRYTILFCITLGLSYQPLYSQKLISDLAGKWKVIKFQKSGEKALSQIDTLEFKSDGTFLSDSIYIKAKQGKFRTDENRSVLIIETNDTTTEWFAVLKNDVLRLHTEPTDDQPKTFMTLMKVKPKEKKKRTGT
jgi:hypothetical protein